MGKKVNPTLIGLFVVGALALAVIGVLVFGSGQFFKHTDPFVMYFPGSVNGLSVGAPIKFKGVDIGTVTDIRLVLYRENPNDPTLTIPVYVQVDPAKISIDGRPLDMTQPEGVHALVERGMRAQLQAQSLVTGLLFVQIDFFPETPIKYVLPQPSTPIEIPTIPTALEQASSVAKEIITELRNVKFGPMIQNASEALASLNNLVSSPALRSTVDALPGTVKNADQAIADIRRLTTNVGGNVDPLVQRLDATMGDVDRTLTSVRETVGVARTLIEPGSPLDHDLRKVLQDVSAAARAMGQLADYLERNPTALLYGKQPPPEVKP